MRSHYASSVDSAGLKRLNTGKDLLLEVRVVRLTEIQGLESGRLSECSFFVAVQIYVSCIHGLSYIQLRYI